MIVRALFLALLAIPAALCAVSCATHCRERAWQAALRDAATAIALAAGGASLMVL